MRKEYDFLLVGAGLFNAVFAQQAKVHGKKCLVIDKRAHLGGNVFCKQIEGIAVHQYGPHVFHTNNKKVWEFVNSFVSFNRFTLNTIANYKGRIFNLPFNMNTFHQMWGVVTPEEAQAKIQEQVLAAQSKNNPQNLEEQAIVSVGRDIFEALIKGYTEKQWGCSCSELPTSILKRIPVRFTYDNNYFNDSYQGIPDGGYNKLIDALLCGVECRTNCDYFQAKDFFDSLARHVVFSGAIDEYFGYQLGQLEYRTLHFEHEIMPISNYQGNAIINYTDINVPYTRIVEHKHFDINNKMVFDEDVTVITHEFPVAWSHTSGMEPYYPINDTKNTSLYEEYMMLAEKEKNVSFGGRLAEYKYYDMDETIESALNTFNLLNQE